MEDYQKRMLDEHSELKDRLTIHRRALLCGKGIKHLVHIEER